jgi:ribonuclease BN (tRNA processing enzyme)
MFHPGQCFAYRVDYKGKSVVYATDAEYKKLGSSDLKHNVEFFRDADLLIFDFMYTFSEVLEKEDWGHSSIFIGVNLAVEANVKQITFFHHEPTCSDFKLMDIFRQTGKYLKLVAPKYDLKMLLSYEGLSLDIFNEPA